MNIQEDNSINVNNIVDRLKEAEGISSDADFARHIGMKPSTLSMARKRNAIDLFDIFKKFEQYSKNWIIDGIGPKSRSELKYDPDSPTVDDIYDVAGLDIESQESFKSDISKLLSLNLKPEKLSEMIKIYIELRKEDPE